MLSSSSSLFDTLPTRPPTPPKDAQDVNEQVQSAVHFLEHGHDDSEENDMKVPKTLPSTDTPPASSPTASSQEPPAGSIVSKKVGFSPYTTYHEVPRPGISSSPGDRTRRSQPRDRNPRPPKSILKLATPLPPPTPDEAEAQSSYFSLEDPSSFGKMLQSVLQALASDVRSSRLDAYVTLNSALKACGNVPDREAMAPKMSLFQQYISRDMTGKDATGQLDLQLATQAVNLVVPILHDGSLSEALGDDFRAFLLDRSIFILEQPNMPKPMIKAHLFLVAQQRFHQSLMIDSRAMKMLSALRTIEDRCSGNSPIGARLVIYQRLLEQNPGVMNAKAREWLQHLFHGMLSGSKDLRGRAVEAGIDAGTVLGTKPAALKALQELFETGVDEKQKYYDYFRERLEEMMAEPETGAYVPQIWSAVILFFRPRQKCLENWQRFPSWLRILQRSLNNSDLTIRYQANLAWHRLVFVIMPDASTTVKMRSLLQVPIMSGLERTKEKVGSRENEKSKGNQKSEEKEKSKEKSNKHIRQMALDNYNNLLHYALRPSLSQIDLDTAWDEYAAPVLMEMVTPGAGGKKFASRVLHGLLTPNAGVWNEKAALVRGPIQPEDLPRLDTRWVRSRMAKILKVVEPLIARNLRSVEHCAAAVSTWEEVLQAIADAGAQEVKTSNELREAIALIMNMFQRLWKLCSIPGSQPKDVDTKLDGFRKLLQTTCKYIGPSLMAEEMLSSTPQGDAQAVPTPSRRASKHQYALQSPLVFVLVMLCRLDVSGVETQRRETVSDLLNLTCEAMTTSATKVQLLAKTSQALYTACPGEQGKERALDIWPLFANLTCGSLMLSHTEMNANGTLGHKLRNASSILARGLPMLSTSADYDVAGTTLVKELVRVAKSKAGDAGVVLAVVEPLAKCLLDRELSLDPGILLKYSTLLLQSAPRPHSRQSMDQARKALWGTGLSSHKAGVFDPFEYVYTLICDASARGYKACTEDPTVANLAAAYVDAMHVFLSDCPTSAAVNALRHVQEGVAIWVEDMNRLAFASGHQLAGSVMQLWKLCLEHVNNVPRKDSTLLSMIQPLLVAGFLSTKRDVVNQAIASWNSTFGEQESLVYPANLLAVLYTLQPYVDLNLPNFPGNAAGDEEIALPAFEDSQPDAAASFSSRWSNLPRGTASPAKMRETTFADHASHLHSLETVSSAKSGSTATSAKPTPRARLRHDDSQVQFAPIESSSLRQEMEPQLLTDRQKEVRDRQKQDAQMFPDLSSSPAKPKLTTRRLDFATRTANVEGDEAVRTPVELPEGHGDMSDYMGSSPTPHSSDKSGSQNQASEREQEEMQPEPPSSPPQSPQVVDSFVADSAEHGRDAGETAEDHFQTARQTGTNSSTDPNAMDGENSAPLNSDLPSNTALPAEQLQLEAEVAVDRSHVEDEQPSDREEPVDETTVIDATELPSTKTAEADQDKPSSNSNGDGAEAADVQDTRVVNALVEAEAPAAHVEAAKEASQESTRSTLKRKRTAGTASNASSKKRKAAQSPLKRWVSGVSSFFGASQNADEDTGDEIVVASSQPTNSPASKRNEQLEVDLEPKASSQPTTSTKRGRSRPRESETPTPAIPATATASTKKSKRKASALSDTTTVDRDTTTVKETPAPTKARKQRKGAAEKPVPEPSSQDDSAESRPSSSRLVATEVAIEPSDTPSSLSRTRMADSDSENPGTPQQQLNRPITTPKSLLGRLKEALVDYKKMILGPGEEREHDDVLFALRTEMHEAGRRGRAT